MKRRMGEWGVGNRQTKKWRSTHVLRQRHRHRKRQNEESCHKLVSAADFSPLEMLFALAPVPVRTAAVDRLSLVITILVSPVFDIEPDPF